MVFGFEKFFTEPVHEPEGKGKSTGEARAEKVTEKKKTQKQSAVRKKRVVFGGSEKGTAEATPTTTEPGRPMGEQHMATTGSKTGEEELEAVAKSVEQEPSVYETSEAQEKSVTENSPEEVNPQKAQAELDAELSTAKSEQVHAAPEAHVAENNTRGQESTAQPSARTSVEKKEFSAEVARAKQIRKELEVLKGATAADFIENLPQYTKLMRSLDKLQPLADGSWEEDEQVAAHLIETERSRMEALMSEIEAAAATQKKDFEASFGDEATQEVLAATLGGLESKKESANTAPKRTGWWNSENASRQHVEEKTEATESAAEAELTERAAVAPEVQEQIDDMRSQITRITQKLNQHRETQGLNHKEAKEHSSGYKHARGKLLAMQNRLRAIENGADVKIEELDGLRSELAQSIWDMRKEMPAEGPEVELGAEGDAVEPEKIRTMVQGVNDRMEKLIEENPILKEEPAYTKFNHQLEKLQQQTDDDESIEAHHSIIQASLKTLERQYLDLLDKTKLESELQETQADTADEESSSERSKELAEDDPDGLFAHGEKAATLDKKANLLTKLQEKMAALIEEDEDLKETLEFREVLAKAKELETADSYTEQEITSITDALFKLRQVSVERKVNAAHENPQDVNATLAADDATGLFAWGEEIAQEKAAAAETLVLRPEDRVDVETTEATEQMRILGSEIPPAGPEGRFAARSFKDGLLLVRGRVEDTETQKKIDDVLRIVGYVPDSGLRKEDVEKLEQLAQQINLPESLVRRKNDSIDAMYAEVERKVAERLPSMKEKMGEKQARKTLGLSTLFGVLTKKNK